jgi:uncharacterized protein (TIGR01777 family)
MKVVIAGGSGLIGTALSRALTEAGHEVVVLTRTNPDRGEPDRPRRVPWDPTVAGDWSAEFVGAGAVVNLAGAPIGRWPWTPRRKVLLRESRIIATRAIVDAIAALPATLRPKVLLNASGTDFYEGRDQTPADEKTDPSSSFLARMCLDWEAEACKAEPLGVRVVLLRTSSVIARGAPYVRVITLPFRLFVGGRLGSGEQWVSWVDLADAVGLYKWALETPAIAGPVNVSAPDPRHQRDYARSLGRALRRPSWFPTPATVIRLLLQDQATLALGSRRVWPAKALTNGYVFRYPQLEDALARAIGERSCWPNPA